MSKELIFLIFHLCNNEIDKERRYQYSVSFLWRKIGIASKIEKS